jgi:uncharacterized spore protein YtfJ
MDVENLLVKASDNVSVRRAFGAAYEKDGVLIIPVATVISGGGGGASRRRPGNPPEGSPTAEDQGAQDSGYTDTGGGFGGFVLPRGAYVVRGDQVRWVPAVDVTIVALAALGLVRVLVGPWIRRRRRRLRPECIFARCATSEPARGRLPRASRHDGEGLG